MKTKTSLMVLSTLGLLMSQVGQAQVTPVLQPEGCADAQNIKFPKGASGTVYMSKDCKTAFVLPNETSPITVTAKGVGPTVNLEDCEQFEGLVKKERYYETQIEKGNALRDSMYADYQADLKKAMSASEKKEIHEIYEGLLNNIDKRIEGNRNIIKEYQSKLPYANYQGVAVNISLKLNHGEIVNKFIELNKDSGLTFKAARISKGILSFSGGKDDKVKVRRVISAEMPGVKPAGGADLFIDTDNRLATGGLAGMITLSQPAACNIIRRAQKSENRTDFDTSLLDIDKYLTAGFSANYTYEVPVSTDVGFQFIGKITGEELKTIFTKTITKSRFKDSEMADLLFQGGLKESIKVSLRDGGIPAPLKDVLIQNDDVLNQPEGNILNILLVEALEMYQARVAEQLQYMGLIQRANVDNAQDISPKQEVTVVHKIPYVDCTTKRNFLGSKKKSCKTKFYDQYEYVPGVSTGEANTTYNQEIGVDVQVQANMTFPMLHSSGFEQE